MSDETRREFLKKAGMAAGAAAVVGLAGSTAVQADNSQLLPKAKFSKLFDDVFALVSEPANKNVSIASLLTRNGFDPNRLPPHVKQGLGPILDRKPGMGTGGVAASECGACGACGLCAICAEADVLSGLAAAAAVTALGASMG